MKSIKSPDKSNNFIGDAYWQNVTQEWRFIEAIARGGLDFKIDEYAQIQGVLKYAKPVYQMRDKYIAPSITEIIIPTTTMTSI
jgi:hypothetical protein